MMLDTFDVDVLEEHIKYGVRYAPRQCALALAVKDKLTQMDKTVAVQAYLDQDTLYLPGALYSHNGQQFVFDFDSCRDVKPQVITFKKKEL